MYAGSIDVRSEVDGGCRFEIRFPMKTDDGPEEATRSDLEARPHDV